MTWGSSEASISSKLSKHFGLPLGQLEGKDFVEIVSKALTTFSEFRKNLPSNVRLNVIRGNFCFENIL